MSLYILAVAFAAVSLSSNLYEANGKVILPVPTVCPEENSLNYTVHLRHDDCTKFYKCDWGVKHEFQCPEYGKHGKRLHFNRFEQVCDYPSRANCTKDKDVTEDCNNYRCRAVEGLCKNYEILVDGTWEKKTCPDNQLFDPNTLHCKWEEDVRIVWREPHEYRCRWYYETVNCKRKTLKQCAYRKLYNKNTKTCEAASSVNCDDYRCPTINVHPDLNNNVSVTHECQCGKYYICQEGLMYGNYCLSGQSFDDDTRRCVDSAQAKCSRVKSAGIQNFMLQKFTESSLTECPSRGHALLPHECSCYKYYKCVDGEEMLMYCPDGKEYDYKKKTCDFADRVHCVRPIPNPIPEPTPQPPPLTECPLRGHALLPHECSCYKYYKCVDGEEMLMYCPDGKEYDYKKKTCDFADRVHCVRPIKE